MRSKLVSHTVLSLITAAVVASAPIAMSPAAQTYASDTTTGSTDSVSATSLNVYQKSSALAALSVNKSCNLADIFSVEDNNGDSIASKYWTVTIAHESKTANGTTSGSVTLPRGTTTWTPTESGDYKFSVKVSADDGTVIDATKAGTGSNANLQTQVKVDVGKGIESKETAFTIAADTAATTTTNTTATNSTATTTAPAASSTTATAKTGTYTISVSDVYVEDNGMPNTTFDPKSAIPSVTEKKNANDTYSYSPADTDPSKYTCTKYMQDGTIEDLPESGEVKGKVTGDTNIIFIHMGVAKSNSDSGSSDSDDPNVDFGDDSGDVSEEIPVEGDNSETGNADVDLTDSKKTKDVAATDAAVGTSTVENDDLKSAVVSGSTKSSPETTAKAPKTGDEFAFATNANVFGAGVLGTLGAVANMLKRRKSRE